MRIAQSYHVKIAHRTKPETKPNKDPEPQKPTKPKESKGGSRVAEGEGSGQESREGKGFSRGCT